MDSINLLRNTVIQGLTRSYDSRMKHLNQLGLFIQNHEKEIEEALYHDLRKSSMEAFITEIYLLKTELRYTEKHLAKWMKPVSVRTNLIAQPGRGYIYREPYGVVLLISPWNYPFLTSLTPVVGALAAGNTVLLKPSELAPATSHLLATHLPRYLDASVLQVVEGGVDVCQQLLAERFDYIFYTGGSQVGRIVMEKAAKFLTPVTLELGGKSPCIVDKTADIDIAAKRIIWGKFLNAGQTCVAPDYVLAHESIEEALACKMQKYVRLFFGDNPQISEHYGRIINDKHHQRLVNMLVNDAHCFEGGNLDEGDLYLSPTLLRGVSLEHPCMQEEIFGPILPIISMKSLDEGIRFIQSRPKPLALYLFTRDKLTEKQVLEQTSSGSLGINQVIRQLSVFELPFGGVGASGMGQYLGKSSYDLFSHAKSVFKMPTWIDPSITYPPYKSILRKILKWI